MGKTKPADVFTVQDLISYILQCQLKHIVSLSVVFIAVFYCYHNFTQVEINVPMWCTKQECSEGKLMYWAYGKNIESGYLRHVFAVLERLGYKYDPNSTDWDLLWAHDYPFQALYPQLHNLKSHQRVNHFPGCGYITNKVELSTSGLKYNPAAFKLPQQKQELLEYSKVHPDRLFVQKSNDHRNIKIQNIESVDLNKEGSFIQEFVDKPFLVDGYKFDIGVYTIITSIDPLRIYIYNGDILFRYCPHKYYPFDPEDLDKYVVGDDYLPSWEVPSLKFLYNELGHSMRDSFDAYVRSKGMKPSQIWEKVEDAIRNAILSKEEDIVNILQRFKSKRNFFEMMRFDLVVDENLEVYLMEANMSPNLSSAHYPPNRLLYEQVIYNLLGLVGLAQRIKKSSLDVGGREEELMLTADKNIMVFPDECSSDLCRDSCMSTVCQLCKPCLSVATRNYLIEAYREHVNRQDCKRIFPPTLDPKKILPTLDLEQYSAENQLQYRWFIGKCLLDNSWC